MNATAVDGKPRRQWSTDEQALKAKHYSRSRSQAKYRKIPWDLSFEVWCNIWGDKWNQRGTGIENYVMRRIDHSDGWCESNVEVVQRIVSLVDKQYAYAKPCV